MYDNTYIYFGWQFGFWKNDRRYFGRIQKFTDSLEFRDNQGIERHAVFEFVKNNDIRSSDIFFLDIDLNAYHSGIGLGEMLREKNAKCKIVYLTSHPNKAIAVINRNITPSGYLIKEFTYEKNKKNIQKS